MQLPYCKKSWLTSISEQGMEELTIFSNVHPEGVTTVWGFDIGAGPSSVDPCDVVLLL
jgi:hypothetical protein